MKKQPSQPQRAARKTGKRDDQSICEAISAFQGVTIQHGMMGRVRDQILTSVSRSAAAKVILVVGPTGVGKTTLAHAVYRAIGERHRSETQAEPSVIPVIGLRAVPPQSNAFSWKDFYTRLLGKTNHPQMFGTKTTPLFSDDIPVGTGDQLASDPLRRCVEVTLRQRHTRVLIVDEAHHMLMCKDKLRKTLQFESLKSLSMETNATILLFGTYDLLEICEQSGQLVRRSEVIHYPRYSGENKRNMFEFREFLDDLNAHLKLPSQRSLQADAQAFFLRSGGCCGILKDWLAKSYEAAMSMGRPLVDYKFAQQFAIPARDLITIIRECEEGEERMKDVSMEELKSRLMPNVFGQPAANEEHIKPTKPERKRRVGERNPARDLIDDSDDDVA